MRTLWTPEGERPIPPAGGASQVQGARPNRQASQQESSTRAPGEDQGLTGHRQPGPDQPADRSEAQERLEELRSQLAATPAAVVVANHCFGLFELAALHLSTSPPHLEEARLAIDGLGYLVDGLGARLGEHASELAQGLTQLRLAFVKVAEMSQSTSSVPQEPASPTGTGEPEEGSVANGPASTA
ncbi:MAG: hypothetical protein M1115_09975 [Actinobacteria bacterium]|nr:hypothetical protein [Actinomycetota bacterium]